MWRQDYTTDELKFAYSYRVYARWHTHCWRPTDALTSLTRNQFRHLVSRHNIRVLDLKTDTREIVVAASLRPHDTVSAAVSKIKGPLSKWLGQRTDPGTHKHLGDGYFACTHGDTTRQKVMAYLSKQGHHHGYTDRVNPPIFEQTFRAASDTESLLQPKHARAMLRYHLVFATWRRKGVFGTANGEAIAAVWSRLGSANKFLLEKVSFVPDHVHLAVRFHPTVQPAELIPRLLNCAEVLMHTEFPEDLIRGGVHRLWQPSAYLGAYGDVNSKRIRAYIDAWRGRGMRTSQH